MESNTANDQGKTADNIYNAFRASVDSRFPDYGKVVLLSFPRYKGDFISNRYESVIAEKNTYAREHHFLLNPDLPKDDPENNFSIIENTVSGISSVVFSGITSSGTGTIITSDFDVNQNQTPRGGIIISLGSSIGLGYAPLVGAAVTAVVGAGGSIVSVGLGTTDNLGSGYNGVVSVGVSVYQSDHIGDTAIITASVGAGGTLSFTVVGGGTGYTNPKVFVSEPSYENLSVIGVSRLGLGATTRTGIGLLLNVEVGASSTTGIGSTYFEVSRFSISRQGYSFRRGDVFKPVGLVTAKGLASPLSEFQLTVVDTFSDSFAAWQFGEFDYIDSVKNYQEM